jgi:hypothetical protein
MWMGMWMRTGQGSNQTFREQAKRTAREFIIPNPNPYPDPNLTLTLSLTLIISEIYRAREKEINRSLLMIFYFMLWCPFNTTASALGVGCGGFHGIRSVGGGTQPLKQQSGDLCSYLVEKREYSQFEHEGVSV